MGKQSPPSTCVVPYVAGHMRAAEVVDFGLDPGSRQEQTGYLPQPPVVGGKERGGGELARP